MKKLAYLITFLFLFISCSSDNGTDDNIIISPNLVGEYLQTHEVGQDGRNAISLSACESYFLELHSNGNLNWGYFDDDCKKVIYDSDIEYQNTWSYLGKETIILPDGTDIETDKIEAILGGGVVEMNVMPSPNGGIAFFRYWENEGYTPWLDFDTAFSGYFKKL